MIRLWLARLICPKTHHVQRHRGRRDSTMTTTVKHTLPDIIATVDPDNVVTFASALPRVTNYGAYAEAPRA